MNNATLHPKPGGISLSSFVLREQTIVIGSSPSVDVHIDQKFISRRHAQVRWLHDVFYISDLGSTNGTFVNGSRIEDNQEVVLKDGDEIVFAQDEITFVFSDPNQTARLTGPPKIADKRDVRVDARIYINVASKEVRIDGKKTEPLSRKEFDILLGLYRNSGNVTSREEIADAGWPERPNGDVSPEEIDQYISRLRRRLEKDPKRPSHIVTRRGFGYQFNN